jgi:glycine/D-amino acid oxidase-like deaminating enzyme
MRTPEHVARSLADAAPRSFWLDQPDAPERLPALTADAEADLAIVGGGFTGLWTALLATERDPSLKVVLLEARTVEQNLREIGETVARYGIDCDFSLTGELAIATAPWQLEGLDAEAETARSLGYDVELLDAAGMRTELDSPLFLGGLKYTTGNAMVEPGRLAWGLRRACLAAGVAIYEGTPVTSITSAGVGLTLTTPYARVRAGQVVLGTGAFSPLLKRIGAYVVPVWDYVLMTEPLPDAQLASLGWRDRRGASDLGNQFHYFRLTRDNRILWGGYDTVYYNGGKTNDELACNPETFAKLATHFFGTFPQLEGVRFTHAWGGVIDTCSRFCSFFGTAYSGRLAYTAGYTGLGVGATRFGAQVLLDKLAKLDTERTRLPMTRSMPVPFPPEPLRSGVIQLTRASIARADRNEGQRDAWLRLLDRLGLGFDS